MSADPSASAVAAGPPNGVSLRTASRVWLRVALLSFGGPAGQIAVMHRILVDEKRWISEQRFLHALNFCMLLPGPEAQQLATYLGWLMHRTRGGLVAGGLFILPGVIAIMALSMLYAAYGSMAVVVALFAGLKAAVLAIVVQAVIRIGRRTMKTPLPMAIAAFAFIAIFFFAVPFPLIILAAALVGFIVARVGAGGLALSGHGASADAASPDDAAIRDATAQERSLGRALKAGAIWLVLWLGPVGLLIVALGRDHVFSDIAVFFSTMAVVTFGGAYAVLAYVAQQAVGHFQWLSPGEMVDGLGMAETTPGPLIMVLQFVGFMAAFRDAGALPPMLAGALGGLLATWVTFVPCFLWIFVGAAHVERLRQNAALSAALAAVTAAVVGVILNLATWFAVQTLFAQTRPVAGFGLRFDAPVWSSLDPQAAALSLVAVFALFRLRLNMIVVLALCAGLGVAIHAAKSLGA